MQQFRDVVLSPAGRPIPGATVTVTISGGGTPTLYSDNGVTALGSNVLTTDAGGEYKFYAANGRYSFAIAATGYTGTTRDEVLWDQEDERISAADFGAVPGVGDNTAALQALVTYVNAIPNNNRYPVKVWFPQGSYIYSTTLHFTRPVAIHAEQGATLYYTGSSYAVKLGPDGITYTGTGIPLNAEYSIDGLRFENCTSAAHIIYINELVTEPRIRNCTFLDCGNAYSYCIFGQYGNWNVLIENCRLLVLNGAGGQNFAAFPGLARTPTGSAPYAVDDGLTTVTGHDGGNSRVTIRDCWMMAYAAQPLGVFALLSGLKSRIVGGGFQWSNYGVYLTGFASGVTLDTVYAELPSTNSEAFITVESTNTSSLGRFHPENLTARNCYVNMHGVAGVTANVLKTVDANCLIRGTRLEDLFLTNIVNNGALIAQQDTTGQKGNYIDVRISLSDPNSTGKQYKVRGTYTNAEPWATPNGVNNEVVGSGTYTLTQADVGRQKTFNGGSPVNWTLPSDTTAVIEVGAAIEVFNASGTAALSLIADTGVTIILTGTGTTGTRTVAANGLAHCRKFGSNVWYVDGPGVA